MEASDAAEDAVEELVAGSPLEYESDGGKDAVVEDETPPDRPVVKCPIPFCYHLVNDQESLDACSCGRRHLIKGGTYKWCSCGRTGEQPMCDDTCLTAPTTLRAMEYTVAADQRWLYLCGCKLTGAPPLCDGSHIHMGRKLDW
eukprot:PLAT9891.1.p2 GENE.PLAT9891.1~~PLAT9891.1.p2  ORF type:complete len:143 (+),score=15.41 PLAT9891.1:254-682(+)